MCCSRYGAVGVSFLPTGPGYGYLSVWVVAYVSSTSHLKYSLHHTQHSGPEPTTATRQNKCLGVWCEAVCS